MAEKAAQHRVMLLDTNIFVDHLRNHTPAVRFFERLAEADNVVLFSTITETELIAGKSNADSRKKEILLHFLHRWDKVPLTNPAAALAGDLGRDYGLDVPDAIIAATALVNRAELVTKNIKDFKHVRGLSLFSPY